MRGAAQPCRLGHERFRNLSDHRGWRLRGRDRGAGGLFQGLPEQPGFAIVIVTHLSPARESRLHEVLAGYTNLPVKVATHHQEVEPNQVYVLPADATLGIKAIKERGGMTLAQVADGYGPNHLDMPDGVACRIEMPLVTRAAQPRG